MIKQVRIKTIDGDKHLFSKKEAVANTSDEELDKNYQKNGS